MLKYLLSLLLVLATLIAQDDETTHSEEDDGTTVVVEELLKERDLYLSYEKLPEKLYINQIFTLTTKVINANKEYTDLLTRFGDYYGVTVLSTQPVRTQQDFTSYDTFYFKATQAQLKTPDLFYTLNRATNDTYEPVKLAGHSSFAVQLNYDQDFCHVLANSFTIESFKTTEYDQDNNIIVFTASSEFANLGDFNLSIASLQGFESRTRSLPDDRMTYYAVIPKHLRSINFNYFNLKTAQYIPITIPIEVDDDSVSTQMDLSPTQYSHSFAKIMVALGLIVVGIVLYLIKRQKRYFFIIALTPILYVAWVYFPKEKVCVKADAKIYLLPMKNSTIFQKYSFKQRLQKLGEVDEYHKVLLQNLNIGWIKDEDLCED
jgi:hypothetical protein